MGKTPLKGKETFVSQRIFDKDSFHLFSWVELLREHDVLKVYVLAFKMRAFLHS